jgi:hypothetical protein
LGAENETTTGILLTTAVVWYFMYHQDASKANLSYNICIEYTQFHRVIEGTLFKATESKYSLDIKVGRQTTPRKNNYCQSVAFQCESVSRKAWACADTPP